jgi:hypothetical protein
METDSDLPETETDLPETDTKPTERDLALALAEEAASLARATSMVASLKKMSLDTSNYLSFCLNVVNNSFPTFESIVLAEMSLQHVAAVVSDLKSAIEDLQIRRDELRSTKKALGLETT